MRRLFVGKMCLYHKWIRRKKKLEMDEVVEEEGKRAKDEELAEVFALKAASPNVAAQAGRSLGCDLPCPAKTQASCVSVLDLPCCSSLLGPCGNV